MMGDGSINEMKLKLTVCIRETGKASNKACGVMIVYLFFLISYLFYFFFFFILKQPVFVNTHL